MKARNRLDVVIEHIQRFSGQGIERLVHPTTQIWNQSLDFGRLSPNPH
jgi:hypothetical protein